MTGYFATWSMVRVGSDYHVDVDGHAYSVPHGLHGRKVEVRATSTIVEDLQVGMILAGVVTNVTNFGAFVDVGVHQDGLVHVSELSDRFIRSPHEVVSAGQSLTVRVVSVDLARRRIALSAKDAKP